MLYLDHAATTPIDPAVLAGMQERYELDFANPSSNHTPGRQARKCLEAARLRIARLIGAKPDQIAFTGGGTESLGWAVLGSAGEQPGRIAISAVEHAAISESAYWLKERLGWAVDVLPVGALGRVKLSSLEQALTPQTRMVATMMVNNEVGAINDVAALAQVVRARCARQTDRRCGAGFR